MSEGIEEITVQFRQAAISALHGGSMAGGMCLVGARELLALLDTLKEAQEANRDLAAEQDAQLRLYPHPKAVGEVA